jgi:hypothetical protein
MFSSCLLSHLHVLREGKVFDGVSSSFPSNYEISLKMESFPWRFLTLRVSFGKGEIASGFCLR